MLDCRLQLVGCMLLRGIALALLQLVLKSVLIQHLGSKTDKLLVEPWHASTLSISMVTGHPQALVYLHQALVSRPTGIIVVVEAVAPTTAAAVLTDRVARNWNNLCLTVH